jgi:hypothetical protein
MTEPALFTVEPTPRQSQRWVCSKCPKTYTSPLPLRIPPVHRCATTAGGPARLRNFELEGVP